MATNWGIVRRSLPAHGCSCLVAATGQRIPGIPRGCAVGPRVHLLVAGRHGKPFDDRLGASGPGRGAGVGRRHRSSVDPLVGADQAATHAPGSAITYWPDGVLQVGRRQLLQPPAPTHRTEPVVPPSLLPCPRLWPSTAPSPHRTSLCGVETPDAPHGTVCGGRHRTGPAPTEPISDEPGHRQGIDYHLSDSTRCPDSRGLRRPLPRMRATRAAGVTPARKSDRRSRPRSSTPGSSARRIVLAGRRRCWNPSSTKSSGPTPGR